MKKHSFNFALSPVIHLAALMTAPGILFSATAASAATPTAVVVSLVRSPHSTNPSRIDFKLSSAKGIFRCETSSIPNHAIKVEELKNLSSPFKKSPVGNDCQRAVRWGEVETCYRPGENRVLDQVITSCVSI